MNSLSRLLAPMAFALVLPAQASDLLVNVSGVSSASGEIGCALYSKPTPPTFDEAVFTVTEGQNLTINVEVAR